MANLSDIITPSNILTENNTKTLTNKTWNSNTIAVAYGGTNATTALGAVQSLVSGTAIPAATVATDDKILIQDTSDTDNVKTVTVQSIADLTTTVGAIIDYAGVTAPAGYLECDGTAVSRTTYAALFSVLSASKGTFTVTIAAPALITVVGHGMETGDVFSVTTTGALPTGLTASTNYFFIKNDADSGWFATTYANAFANTRVTTSGSQSGVHTLLLNPWGISGASDFLLPDFRRRSSIGADGTATATIGNRVGNTGGAETHTLTVPEIPSHTHGSVGQNTGSGSNEYFVPPANNGTLYTTSATGGGGAHNNMQPSAVVMKIIKT